MDLWVDCNNCAWYGTEQCDEHTEENESEDRGCSYSPVIEMVSDEEAALLVEEGRKEYDNAWNSYIKDFYFSYIKYDI